MFGFRKGSEHTGILINRKASPCSPHFEIVYIFSLHIFTYLQIISVSDIRCILGSRRLPSILLDGGVTEKRTLVGCQCGGYR